MKNFLYYSLLLALALSCQGNVKENQGQSANGDPLKGFWNRVGTIQSVNGQRIDTIYYSDTKTENFHYHQIKGYIDGSVIFIINAGDSVNNPWKGGAGGYGKFTTNSKNSVSENFSGGTGFFGSFVKYYKDSLNIPYWNIDLKTELTDKSYQQFMGETTEEYYSKMPAAAPKSELDGVWKRIYEIIYVNGVPVDTTSVSSDALLDVKVMHEGHFIYQVDLTALNDSDKPQYGGYGAYGKFDYDGKGNLVEYSQIRSGMGYTPTPKNEKIDGDYKTVSFYNEDLFLQIDKDTLSQGNNGRFRGLVYKRIKN